MKKDSSAEQINSQKTRLCDDTLRCLLKDFEERFEILKKRKPTPITLGRINEIQMCIVHLRQKVLDDII